MAEAATKLPVKTEEKGTGQLQAGREWWPVENLRREVNRLFEDFDRGIWRSPFRLPTFDVEPLLRPLSTWDAAPAVDIVEKEKAYEIAAELPGMDEKNVEIRLSDGRLLIKGEKKEEKEEKRKDYYLSERRYGSFERWFRVPEGVDTDKIEAAFKKGVLTVTLPKKPEAQKPEKKIEVKGA